MLLGDNIAVESFAVARLVAEFGDNASVYYLADYLADLGVTVVLIEQKYVDRHYLDDFTEHYATTFTPPVPHCQRWHFFAEVNEAQLADRLTRGQSGLEARDEAADALQPHYLGFVNRRPVPKAWLGRSVLRTYTNGRGHRNYTAVRDYTVHVAGISLTVRGLAYQQQDGGAAVCASTALWSAFQQVAKMTGGRTPTPIAVTKASGSPFPPSHGLGFDEMARAIATLGFGADEFARVDNAGLFRAQLLSFLRSNLPVVLFLSGRLDGSGQLGRLGHAVTVTGYANAAAEPVDLVGQRLILRGAGAQVVYVHDDNLGSHAHYELQLAPARQPDGTMQDQLVLFRGNPNRPPVCGWTPDRWLITGAIVPRPAKMRMPIEQLYQLLGEFRELLEWVLTHGVGHAESAIQMVDSLIFDACYTRGIELQHSLVGGRYAMNDVLACQMSVTFPRHVAIVEASVPGAVFVQFVYDATSLSHHQVGPILVAAPNVPEASPVGAALKQLANHLGARTLMAP